MTFKEEADRFLADFKTKLGIHDLWEFGTQIKGKEMYIKSQPGAANRATICVSFHLAEFPMTYPFK